MESGHGQTSIRYDDWKQRIHETGTLPEVLEVVRAYLAAWTPEDLHGLPWDLAAPALQNADDILFRATLASRAELKSGGASDNNRLLQEMALMLEAAASRLRHLRAQLEA